LDLSYLLELISYDLFLYPLTFNFLLDARRRVPHIDMNDPMIYILAPFMLAFGLFVLYLVVAIFLKDPARPFRMFKAPPLDPEGGSPESRVQSQEKGQGEGGREEDQFDV
jgi:hypothetical protein